MPLYPWYSEECVPSVDVIAALWAKLKYAYLEGRDTGDLYAAAVHADRLFFISLSMITAGMMSVVQWQGLFPNRQDYLALKPLPIRLHQVFLARFLSSFVIVVIVIADLNLATSILFPFLTRGRWQPQSFGVHYIVAHAVATFGAGLFVYFAIGALQGVLLNALPPRTFDRCSVLIQALLVAGILVAIPYVLDIPNWHEMIAARPRWMSIFPPAWFLGLYENLLGTRDIYFWRLHEMAIMGFGAVLFLAFAAHFLSYRRHASRLLEQAPSNSGGRWALVTAKPFAILVKHSQTRAAFVFAIQTLRRSRHHRLLTAFGVATALVLALQTAGPSMVAHLRSGAHWTPWQLQSILAIPLVISTALISVLCYVFQLPSEVQANWVFRMAESSGRRALLDSVECLLVFFGVVPALLFAAPIEILGLGWVLACAHTSLVAVLMLILIEARLNGWHKIPFICSYVPAELLAGPGSLSAVFLGRDTNCHLLRGSLSLGGRPAGHRRRAHRRLLLPAFRSASAVETGSSGFR